MITTNQLTNPIGQLALFAVFRKPFSECVVKIEDSRRHWLFGLQYKARFGAGLKIVGDNFRWVSGRDVYLVHPSGQKALSKVWEAYQNV